jgi:hypothetical protein
LPSAIDFADLEKDPDLAWLEAHVIPTQDVLPFADLRLPEKDMGRIFNGMTVFTDAQDGTYKIYQGEAFYGLAEVKNGKAKAKIKLC